MNSLVDWYRPGRIPVPALATEIDRLAFDGLLAAR